MRQRIPNRDWVAGALLILVGLTLLARGLAPDLERFVPLLVGLVLLGLTVGTRAVGTLVPGGMVTGVGLGVLLAASSPEGPAPGLLVLSTGIGFLIVTVFALLLGLEDRQLWATVPGVVLVSIGVALVATNAGQGLLLGLGAWWPVVLVAVGAWVLITSHRPRPEWAPGDRSLAEDLSARLRHHRETRDRDDPFVPRARPPSAPTRPASAAARTEPRPERWETAAADRSTQERRPSTDERPRP